MSCCIQTTFCLSICRSVAAWVASTSWPRWIVLLCTWVCKSVCKFLLPSLLLFLPKVESLDHMVIVFFF